MWLASQRPSSPPSPLCRTLGPQLAWGTGKARYLAPSRETPEVRDEPPSPCPRFMIFALSLLRETTSGADTSGPASLGPGAFPNPPHPALLAHAHTRPQSITLSHTLVSTQVHNPTPLVHTQMHTHTIFVFIPTHFSRTLTLAHVISSYSRTNARPGSQAQPSHVHVHIHSCAHLGTHLPFPSNMPSLKCTQMPPPYPCA